MRVKARGWNRHPLREIFHVIGSPDQLPGFRIATLQFPPAGLRVNQVSIGKRQVQFRNTNLLVRNPTWDIGLQKTGYISEAGRCLVMQAQLAGRKLIMVFLDSAGKLSRIADAERVRHWLEKQPQAANPGGTTVIRQVSG